MTTLNGPPLIVDDFLEPRRYSTVARPMPREAPVTRMTGWGEGVVRDMVVGGWLGVVGWEGWMAGRTSEGASTQVERSVERGPCRRRPRESLKPQNEKILTQTSRAQALHL